MGGESEEKKSQEPLEDFHFLRVVRLLFKQTGVWWA